MWAGLGGRGQEQSDSPLSTATFFDNSWCCLPASASDSGTAGTDCWSPILPQEQGPRALVHSPGGSLHPGPRGWGRPGLLLVPVSLQAAAPAEMPQAWRAAGCHPGASPLRQARELSALCRALRSAASRSLGGSHPLGFPAGGSSPGGGAAAGARRRGAGCRLTRRSAHGQLQPPAAASSGSTRLSQASACKGAAQDIRSAPRGAALQKQSRGQTRLWASSGVHGRVWERAECTQPVPRVPAGVLVSNGSKRRTCTLNLAAAPRFKEHF